MTALSSPPRRRFLPADELALRHGASALRKRAVVLRQLADETGAPGFVAASVTADRSADVLERLAGRPPARPG